MRASKFFIGSVLRCTIERHSPLSHPLHSSLLCPHCAVVCHCSGFRILFAFDRIPFFPILPLQHLFITYALTIHPTNLLHWHSPAFDAHHCMDSWRVSPESHLHRSTFRTASKHQQPVSSRFPSVLVTPFAAATVFIMSRSRLGLKTQVSWVSNSLVEDAVHDRNHVIIYV